MFLESLIWIAVFVVSLVVLVKGADWLLESAEKIGLSIGLSPFIVGVVIVGAGTSFPELISSLAAVISGANEIVVANAIGSNIANILLVIGFSAVLGKVLTVTKNLIDLDIPLLATSTVLFLFVVWDGHVNLIESLILLTGYGVYLSYTIMHRDELDDAGTIKLPGRADRRRKATSKRKPKVGMRDYVMLGAGVISLLVGAKFLVDSVVELSSIWNIATGVISIIAVAFGTSLPELLVSAKAALARKSEVALGNIFGSNVFNILVVTGVPGLFTTLRLDEPTLTVGVPAVAMATLLFVISGISRRIHMWEGYFYLLFYGLFIGKVFNIF